MDEVMFKFKGAGDRDLCLGATHEEIITPLVGNFVNSYRDLPVSVFQIQTKYRNEKRAKSGVLRGREFRMKDMYSFHKTVEDLDDYYDEATQAYWNVLERCGLKEISYFTYASGGAFSKYSHEFQTVTEAGEDIIHICQDCGTAVNVEIMDDLNHTCPKCGGKHFEQTKAIETANIFKLMTRFSSAFKLGYQDEQGQHQDQIYMGCYGIGTSRLIGAVVEACHDESGMIWPTQIAPYQVHLVSLVQDANDIQKVDAIYETLLKSGIEVLYDDREKVRAGAKFSDSDLIGLPYRVTVGKKALENNVIEVKNRKSGDVSEISLSDFIARF
jgi:prolyl-tRNA synthetase